MKELCIKLVNEPILRYLNFEAL